MAKNTKKMEIVIGAKDKTKGVFKKIKAGFSKLKGMAGKVGASMAAGFAVAGAALIALTAKVLTLGDNLAKTSDKLGVTTEELSALRHAGELAGLSIGEVDKSIQFMQRNMAEAADGMAAQKDAFDALGLSADKLQKKNPADAMQEIVGALAGIENQSKKVQIAMDIFGRSGASVLNLTAEGMKAAREEAELFGIAMSRADAKKIENINDAMTRIKAALTGASIQLVKTFAPALEKIGNKLAEWGASGSLSLWAKDLGNFIVNVIPKGLILLLEIMGNVTMGFRGWALLWNELKIGFLSFTEAIWSGLNSVRNGVTAFLEAININGVFDDAIATSKRIAGEQQLIMKQLNKDKRQALTDQNEAIKKGQEEQDTIAKLKGQVDAFAKSLEDEKKINDAQAESVDKLATKWDKAAEAKQKYVTISVADGQSAGRVFGDEDRLRELERQQGG